MDPRLKLQSQQSSMDVTQTTTEILSSSTRSSATSTRQVEVICTEAPLTLNEGSRALPASQTLVGNLLRGLQEDAIILSDSTIQQQQALTRKSTCEIKLEIDQSFSSRANPGNQGAAIYVASEINKEEEEAVTETANNMTSEVKRLNIGSQVVLVVEDYLRTLNFMDDSLQQLLKQCKPPDEVVVNEENKPLTDLMVCDEILTQRRNAIDQKRHRRT